MKKKLISTILSISVIAGSFFAIPAQVEAAENYLSPDVAVLENILNGDRHFVIDTLIGTNYKTDFSTNPHAIVNYIGNENTMMDNVLSQYQNKDDPNYDPLYSMCVWTMEKVYNSKDYMSGAADLVADINALQYEIPASILGIDSAETFAQKLTKSTGELKYESVLKEVLSADYTSSDGSTLSTKEMELENLERLDKGLKGLKAFADFFKSSAAANHMNDDTFDDRMSYYNDYLIPYAENIEGVLDAFCETQTSEGKSNERQKEDMIKFIKFISTLNQFDRFEQANKEIETDIVYYAPTFFVSDEALDVIKRGDKAISTVSKALSAYMFIQSIATQSDAMKGALTRMANTTDDADMESVLINFSNEIGESENTLLIGHETLMKYIRDSGVVTGLYEDAFKSLGKELMSSLELTRAGLFASGAANMAAKGTNVIGIASWCADEIMDFGGTCKKTYELKYLKKIIEQAVKTYRADLNTYLSNKTEENAKAVLEDLMMIQKLRLRGETIAYKMTEGQWNSPLGRLLATGTLNPDEMLIDYLDSAYQARVDAFIGASAMPLSTDSLTIKDGETLAVFYSNEAGLYGSYTKADGKQYSIGELDYRIANGITVNSGGKIIMGTDTPSVYIPYIANNGGQLLISRAPVITELVQSSGSAVLGSSTYYIDNIELTGGELYSNTSANINSDSVVMSGTPSVSNVNITTNTCDISSTWNMSGNTLTVNNAAKVSGTLTSGAVYYNGDSLGGGGTVENLVISGNKDQTLSGALNVTNLTYSNTGTVTQTGALTVSGTVKNASSKVINGQNTILKSTGSIIGNYYNCGLTLDGVTLDKAMTFNGILKTTNYVSTADITTNSIHQTGGVLTLNGTTRISGDSYFGGTVTQEGDSYYAGGDVYTTTTNSFKNVYTNGNTLQTLSGTLNMNNLTNSNPAGLEAKSIVNISGTLTNTSGKISGTGITLLSGGSFGSDYYNGDVTIQSTTIIPTNITGNVIIQANESIDNDTRIGGDLTISGGNLAMTSSKLTVQGSFNNSKNITADEESSIICNSAFINSGTMTGNGAVLNIKDIIRNSGTLDTLDITLNKEMSNTGTISGGMLATNSEISNGGNINIKKLMLKPNTLLAVTGNNVTAENLVLSGIGKVRLDAEINVTGVYTNNGISVNDDRIIISSGKTLTENRSYETLNMTTDLVLDNCTLTVDNFNTRSNITLINGARLIVNKKFNSNGSSTRIEVDKSSTMDIKHIASISSGTMAIEGNVIFYGDTQLSAVSITGGGMITVKGDLYGGTISAPVSFKIIGKTKQVITSSGTVGDLEIDNTSRGGVAFTNTIYYSGELETNGSNITGNVIKK